MTREDIISVLKDYRQLTGRRAYLKVEMDRLTKLIEKERKGISVHDHLKYTKSVAVCPNSKDVYAPTEDTAQKILDGEDTPLVTRLVKKRQLIEGDYLKKDSLVRFADAWLEGLKQQESLVLVKQLVDHESWLHVQKEYENAFKEEKSVATLKKMKYIALSKIEFMTM